MGTEPPTDALIDGLLSEGWRVMVPALGEDGRALRWTWLGGLSELASRGPRRPREPRGASFGPELIAEADLIIAPALAIDHAGTRLGRGGGWYDRALLHRSPDAALVAMCWSWEFQTDTLPVEPHDVPVDAVLTERALTMLSDGLAS